jgi:hypothetical protein
MPRRNKADVRILLGIFPYDVTGTVAAAVIGDDHFEREVGLLGKPALDGFGDESFHVVGRGSYGYHVIIHHCDA